MYFFIFRGKKRKRKKKKVEKIQSWNFAASNVDQKTNAHGSFETDFFLNLKKKKKIVLRPVSLHQNNSAQSRMMPDFRLNLNTCGYDFILWTRIRSTLGDQKSQDFKDLRTHNDHLNMAIDLQKTATVGI